MHYVIRSVPSTVQRTVLCDKLSLLFAVYLLSKQFFNTRGITLYLSFINISIASLNLMNLSNRLVSSTEPSETSFVNVALHEYSVVCYVHGDSG